MAEYTLGKDGKVAPESIKESASPTVKKAWHSPELTEMDYDKTNSSFSGSTFDGLYYS